MRFYTDIMNRYIMKQGRVKKHKDVKDMKIGEARQIYSGQIKAYQQQKVALSKQKQELEKKMNATQNGKELFAKEAAVLELTYNAVSEKQEEYQNYMDKLMQQWTGLANVEASKQQGEAMEEYVADMGKVMEVARRLMKGDMVPATDEKKLMEYSMELYQSAKSMGAMKKLEEREEHDSLWKDEEKPAENPDPMEVADSKTVFADGPAIVDVADTIAAAVPMEE